MAVTISTFPPCILACKACYVVYLPSVMNQSRGLIILLKPRFFRQRSGWKTECSGGPRPLSNIKGGITNNLNLV